MANTVMQAPKGVTQSVIEGHTYEVPADGRIKVITDSHIPVLTRHGYTPAVEEDLSPEELVERIDAMDSKEELVTFIEERGGEADTDMSFKKLKRLAREAIVSDEE